MDQQKISESSQRATAVKLRRFGLLIGQITLIGCATTTPGPLPPGPLSIASLGPIISEGASCRSHVPSNLAQLHPDITGGISTTYGNKDAFDLSVVRNSPVRGQQIFDQEITQKQVFLGPAVAAFKPFGGQKQTAYVPAGWIGYVELENDRGLRCHMIPVGQTELERRIVKFIAE